MTDGRAACGVPGRVPGPGFDGLTTYGLGRDAGWPLQIGTELADGLCKRAGFMAFACIFLGIARCATRAPSIRFDGAR